MSGHDILNLVAEGQDAERFRRQNWIGTFPEYLDLAAARPEITRNAFQRLYDMVVSHGVDTVVDARGERTQRYPFFDDERHDRRDAVFGLGESLQQLMNALHSAARGFGIERRVLLLHGPVGSSKSTIARLLKRGLEEYSRTDQGALYALGWLDAEDPERIHWCPMNEEPCT